MLNKWIKIARILFYMNAFIWLFIGTNQIINLQKISENKAVFIIITILLFVNAALFYIAGWGLPKQKLFFYLLAIGLLLGNILLTFTDQVGVFDIATFFIDCILLGITLYILIKDRQKGQPNPNSP